MIELQWKKQHLLVVGDVMLDKYIWGDVERISPEAPIPIVRVVRTTEQPGGAANVAMNAVALGSKVTLAGMIGDDSDGRSLKAGLESFGICSRLTPAADRPTTSKTRILGGRQQMLRLDLESSAEMAVREENALLTEVLDALEADPGSAGSISVLVLSDYAKGVLTERVCHILIERARGLGIPVIVDPKRADFSRYRGATTLCPNLAELALATGTEAADMDAVMRSGEAMLETLRIESLAVTLSERGIMLLDGKTRRHFPARAQQVFDVSGAGDTVTAVLALCKATKMVQTASIHLANLAAGLVVGKVGTAPVHAHELIGALAAEADGPAHHQEWSTRRSGDNSGEGSTADSIYDSRRKILPLEQMAERVQAWRSAGERVVFTNGCFDLLHSGHIAVLEEARRLGDRVVVGLNSDASVRLLKGPSRPVANQDQRARLLAALSMVDGVVIFVESTPLAMVLALRPDVLVKGGDYIGEEVIGAREVRSWGGKTVIVPLLPGFSTTRILADTLSGRSKTLA